MFISFLVITLVFAVVNWWAAQTGNKPWEYAFKPLTMVALIAATLAITDPASSSAHGSGARIAMVIGLALSLLGDIALMLPGRYFIQGLAAFLLAHIAYIVALALFGLSWPGVALGVVFVVVAAGMIAPRIVRGARSEDPRMGAAVTVYLSVISLMVIAAFGTGSVWAIPGAVLFYASDGCIGWDKFVKELPYRHLLVMVTYHLGQIGLVLSLAL
ncbi:MAG: lysoplasmalogenase [Microthrixaceae bacterium]|nr:lysoplasmalogenase [Microthrixaceae bacterium]